MVGHAVPGVVGFQNLHRHLPLLQQLTDEDWNQILGFKGLPYTSFSKNSFEAFFQNVQKIRSQAPHIHGYQRIYINNHTVCLPLLQLRSLRCSWFPQPLSSFHSSILQIPRVTPPLSDRMFFRMKPAIQDLPPFTR